MMEETCRKVGRVPNIRFECSSQPEIASIVRCGLAAGVLPEIARGEFCGVDVVEMELKRVPESAADIQLVWSPRNLEMNTSLERVRGLLLKALRLA